MEMIAKIFIIVLFVQNTFSASGIEEQRKYLIDPAVLKNEQIKKIAPFVFHPHQQYTTYDIYFDTPEWTIKNASHSLRLRRVEKNIGQWEYAVQLKSEMTQLGEIRTEVEHKDLFRQKVGESSIPELMDQFVEDLAKRPEIMKKFSAWMARKKESSLAPFQKMKVLKIDSSGLRPVIWGKSVRQRYHVYTRKNSSVARAFFVKNSEKNIFMVPDFFKKQPELIWMMEASYDLASFHDLLSGKTSDYPIHELELENKYRPRKLGTALLNDLEKKMFDVWKATTNRNSKYLQSVNFFYPENKND